MGRRTQAERDAITVEIGYAVVTGFLVGGLTFLAIAGPVMVTPMPAAAERGLVLAGTVAGLAVFVVRVVHVLWRFPGGPGRNPQPSQPGRTKPDS
ncbi:hypothetical protein FBY35_4469 [Streptomyces sp. SLBN-118]|uniref:DUF6332 family protein n=1 Tax=Streptomyces sp. SLBN-118 TaxID=2768454 RepID=UPI001152B6C4|nr:DUF6332 family protein [Streptomyces sp. SLBN-118]TQK43022.1 hypothetical protein FBY35_4469 [Streptomyces sp. SLBN-118]